MFALRVGLFRWRTQDIDTVYGQMQRHQVAFRFDTTPRQPGGVRPAVVEDELLADPHIGAKHLKPRTVDGALRLPDGGGVILQQHAVREGDAAVIVAQARQLATFIQRCRIESQISPPVNRPVAGLHFDGWEKRI